MEWIEWHHVCIRQWTQGSSRRVPLRVPRSPFIDHANTRTWNGCPLVKGDAPIRTVFYTYNIQNYFPHNACEYDPSQVCYCDTDSVIFIYDETNPKHKSPEKHKATNLEFGKGLGQWEDEFDRWVCPPNNPGERGGKRKYWQSALGLARLDGREAELAFMAKYPRPENREEDEAFARRWVECIAWCTSRVMLFDSRMQYTRTFHTYMRNYSFTCTSHAFACRFSRANFPPLAVSSECTFYYSWVDIE